MVYTCSFLLLKSMINSISLDCTKNDNTLLPQHRFVDLYFTFVLEQISYINLLNYQLQHANRYYQLLSILIHLYLSCFEIKDLSVYFCGLLFNLLTGCLRLLHILIFTLPLNINFDSLNLRFGEDNCNLMLIVYTTLT